ncbi:hypothetical protein [Roseibium album]|uniref:hypothetical protein n=1 Tax=Roseibium album TaxID=311410 RepID=UPI00391D3A71
MKRLEYYLVGFRKVFHLLGAKVAAKMEVKESVPWSDYISEYDREHFSLYMKLLNAASDGADDAELARSIFGVDQVASPASPANIVESHLARANWLLVEGYKELFAK